MYSQERVFGMHTDLSQLPLPVTGGCRVTGAGPVESPLKDTERRAGK